MSTDGVLLLTISILITSLMGLIIYIWQDAKADQKERNDKLDKVNEGLNREISVMQKQIRDLRHNYKSLHDYVKYLLAKSDPDAKIFFMEHQKNEERNDV